MTTKKPNELNITKQSTQRALVLGGGGAAGNAWLIGVITGLFDAGLGITGADLIIGTSAGSTAAAQITGASPARLFADILSVSAPQQATPAGAGSGRVSGIPADHLERTSRIISTAENPADMRRKMGAVALAMDGASDPAVQQQWRATVAARLPSRHWPQQKLLIPAVNAHTAEPIVFDRHSGVDLADAVAASCAGGFAYTINGNQYFDGGYRTDVNADLAAGYDRVLIIPPFSDKTRKPLEWGLHVTAQTAELRAAGSMVETIFPDTDAQNIMGQGMNRMDLSTRRPSAQAGYNQGKALASQLTKFWH